MSTEVLKSFFRGVVAALVVVGASAAVPLPEPTEVEGNFADPKPVGSGDTSTPGQFSWGSPPSLFTYDTSAITPEGSGWDIGIFSYSNGASAAGGSTNVNLTLDIKFDGSSTALPFPFVLKIVNSDNVTPDQWDDLFGDGLGVGPDDELGAADASRDTVQIKSPLPFPVGDYTLTLSFIPIESIDPNTGLFSGITSDGSQFSVLEDSTASARVIASITPGKQSSVPDGGSTLALLGSVIASLGIARRIRR